MNRIKTDPVGFHGYSASATNGPSSTPPFSNSSSNGVTASDIVWDWTSRPNIPKYDYLQLFNIFYYYHFVTKYQYSSGFYNSFEFLGNGSCHQIHAEVEKAQNHPGLAK